MAHKEDTKSCLLWLEAAATAHGSPWLYQSLSFRSVIASLDRNDDSAVDILSVPANIRVRAGSRHKNRPCRAWAGMETIAF